MRGFQFWLYIQVSGGILKIPMNGSQLRSVKAGSKGLGSGHRYALFCFVFNSAGDSNVQPWLRTKPINIVISFSLPVIDLRMDTWHFYGIRGDINGSLIQILQKGHEKKLCLLLAFGHCCVRVMAML